MSSYLKIMAFSDLFDVLGTLPVPNDVHRLTKVHLSQILQVHRHESLPGLALVLVEDCHHWGEVHKIS